MPVEEIVESRLGIAILPVVGLQDTYGYVGFTAADLTEISVDEFVCERRPARFRFTLAHEVGHIVLHADIYQHGNFRLSQEWEGFMAGIPVDQREWMEWQANSFAGLLLVPGPALVERARAGLNSLRQAAPTAGVEILEDYLVDILAREFEVSAGVIRSRLDKDHVRENIGLYG